MVGYRIAVLPLPCRSLDKVELLNIPGNRCLGCHNAPFQQQRQKLLLGLHRFLGNDGKNRFLTVIFHILQPP